MANPKDVEQSIFEWIDGLGLAGTGSLAELPRAADKEDVALWTAGISGMPEQLRVRSEENIFAFTMQAYFRGIYADRDTAWADFWKIASELPVSSSTISNVQRLDAMTLVAPSRDVVELENDLTAGGPLRIWAIELDMEVTFER